VRKLALAFILHAVHLQMLFHQTVYSKMSTFTQSSVMLLKYTEVVKLFE